MTRVYLSEAAARKMGLNLNDSTLTQEARKPRRAATHPSPPPSVDSSKTQPSLRASYDEVVGLFGGTLHRWLWTPRVDGYISVCGRVQRNNEPPKGEGVRCEACYIQEAE